MRRENEKEAERMGRGRENEEGGRTRRGRENGEMKDA